MSPQLRPWCFEHKQDPTACADEHAQREQHEAMVESWLMQGRCPFSGSTLQARDVFDGPTVEGGEVMSCGVCDCFGFDKSQVGTL